MSRNCSCSNGLHNTALAAGKFIRNANLLCWEQKGDGFLSNALTASHLKSKTVTGTRTHPDTSALCYPSKMKSLEMPFSGFILVFVAALV